MLFQNTFWMVSLWANPLSSVETSKMSILAQTWRKRCLCQDLKNVHLIKCNVQSLPAQRFLRCSTALFEDMNLHIWMLESADSTLKILKVVLHPREQLQAVPNAQNPCKRQTRTLQLKVKQHILRVSKWLFYLMTLGFKYHSKSPSAEVSTILQWFYG